MLEYSPQLIAGMDNQAEYLQACVTCCKPWLAQEAGLRHYRVLAEFQQAAHGVWKALAGPTTNGTRGAKMAATEILRRAERALILAIKAGQEHGEIGKQGEIGGWPEKEAGRERRRLMTIKQASGLQQSYLQELRPMGALSDEEFEAALARSRDMGRMSRTSILRVAHGGDTRGEDWVPLPTDRSSEATTQRGVLIGRMARAGDDSRQMQRALGVSDHSVRQIARNLGIDIPADQVIARTKHLRADRILTEAVSTLEGVAMSLDLVDVWELDRDEIRSLRLTGQRAVRKITARFLDIREVEEKDREYANSNSPA